MLFEKKENGTWNVEMKDWSLTLTPVKNEKKEYFIGKYYENGQEKVEFTLNTDYNCSTYDGKVTPKVDKIFYKIVAFFEALEKLDELEEFDKNLKE